MPARRTSSSRRTSKKKPASKKVYIQDLMRLRLLSKAFSPNPRCHQTKKSSGSKKRKTPQADAKLCVGTVKVGSNASGLYYSRTSMKKNPHFKGSTTPTGSGAHLTAKWEKLYNTRTKKAMKVKDLPKGFPIPW
jgi:hypothetical protein